MQCGTLYSPIRINHPYGRLQQCDHGPPGSGCLACTRLGRECIYPPGGIHAPRESLRTGKRRQGRILGRRIGYSQTLASPNERQGGYSVEHELGRVSQDSKSDQFDFSEEEEEAEEEDEEADESSNQSKRSTGGMTSPRQIYVDVSGLDRNNSDGSMRTTAKTNVDTAVDGLAGQMKSKNGSDTKHDLEFTDSDNEEDEDRLMAKSVLRSGNGGRRQINGFAHISGDSSGGSGLGSHSSSSFQGDKYAASRPTDRTRSSATHSSRDRDIEHARNPIHDVEEEIDELMDEETEEQEVMLSRAHKSLPRSGLRLGSFSGSGSQRSPAVKHEVSTGILDVDVEVELLDLLEEPKQKKARLSVVESQNQTQIVHPYAAHVQSQDRHSGAPRSQQADYSQLAPAVNSMSNGNPYGNSHSDYISPSHAGSTFPVVQNGAGTALPIELPVYSAHPSPYAMCLQGLLPALPPPKTQAILFHTFFSDVLMPEGLTLLERQYKEDYRGLLQRRSRNPPLAFRPGDATTLAVAFAIMAFSLRVLPEETSQLFLSSLHVSSYPRSLSRIINSRPPSLNDTVSLHRRYMDHAVLASQLSDADDPPSLMHVFCKLVLYRYATLCATSASTDPITGAPAAPRVRDRLVIAGGWLAQGIKIAQAMGMSREWGGIPTVERELRRRVFWALYVADRNYSFRTSFPYMILDQHTTLNMPSCISEEDLFKIAPGSSRSLRQASSNEQPTASTHLYILSLLSKLSTKLFDSYAINTADGTDPDLIERYDASLNDFEDALPPFFRTYPHTNLNYDYAQPYLNTHRLHIHSAIFGLRLSVHRPQLTHYLDPTTPVVARQRLSRLCNVTLRVSRQARMQEVKVAFRLLEVERVFEACMLAGLVYRVEQGIAAAKADDPGLTGVSMMESEDKMRLRMDLAEGIEVLESVLSWPDANYAASKSLRVLRLLEKKLAMLSASGFRPISPRGHDIATSTIREIQGWLESWKGVNVDMLMVEAEMRDWETILERM